MCFDLKMCSYVPYRNACSKVNWLLIGEQLWTYREMNVVDATETVGDLVTATAILANNTILLFQMLIARLDIDFLSR